MWVSHKLDKEIEHRLQLMSKSSGVKGIAVMPDVHLAGDVCNGIVLATQNKLYPQAVGGDIGCGYLSVCLDADANQLNEDLAAFILSKLYQSVPIIKQRKPLESALSLELSSKSLQNASQREGRLQLGTLGRGNHFIELQSDQNRRLCLLIHSGSRAMGQLISDHHLSHATVDSNSGLKFLDAESEAGLRWLNDHNWARAYAASNRLTMLDAIQSQILIPLGIRTVHRSTIHLDHNHVESEIHNGDQFWVHRKGAQRLLPDETGVVPGSMGTTTYLVSGRECVAAFHSCAHGAGRKLRRKEAAKALSTRLLQREMNGVWFDQRKRKRLLDEAPSAYKDIRKVMKAQSELVRIVGSRKPVLSFKG